ncbi:MAG: hypothetical protein ACK5HU_03790 [Flavobacteriales bacterium]
MRKLPFLLLIVFSIFPYAQDRYHYVIIPNKFDDFGKKENPYGLSSSARYLFNKKNIKTVRKTDVHSFQIPCEGLTADIQNVSSLFKNKIRFILKNCNGIEVYSAEGKGISKEFKAGYTEALQKAMAGLQNLPYKNNGIQDTSSIPLVPSSTTPITQEIVETTDNEYEAQNLYFNNTYMLDLVEKNDKKLLKIINGELLGYEKSQTIATLSPSDINDTYFIQWITPNGKNIHGVAKFLGKELQISLSSDDGNKLIKVKKP